MWKQVLGGYFFLGFRHASAAPTATPTPIHSRLLGQYKHRSANGCDDVDLPSCAAQLRTLSIQP